MHGGASPQARAAAARRKADAQATATLQVVWNPDAAPVTDPVEALASLAGKLEHAVDVLGARVEVSDLDGTTALAWSRAMRELRTALEALQRLGLDERRVRITEQTAGHVAAVLRAALDRIGLTDEQWSVAHVVVPEELRRLAGDHVPPPVVRGEVE